MKKIRAKACMQKSTKAPTPLKETMDLSPAQVKALQKDKDAKMKIVNDDR